MKKSGIYNLVKTLTGKLAFALILVSLLGNYANGACMGKPMCGVCYGPFREGQSPGGIYPSREQIEEDILILRELTSTIRTYGIDDVLFEIPEICNDYGLDCYVGCWVSGNYGDDQNTISDLIEIEHQGYNTTKALIVGNEYIYRNLSDPCSVPYLTGLINQVRQATDIPVTTGEPWDIWFVHPELVDAVDFIAIHHYAFWRGFDISIAAQENINVYNAVKNAYPDKEVMILETGWPTEGDKMGAALPSEENQEKFLKDFIPLAKENNIKSFIFEAFDEPWKGSGVEGHWGLYYENRTIKRGLQGILSANLADINFDGDVNNVDLSMFTTDWLEQREPNDLCFSGDINHSGIINFYDFVELANNWLWHE